MTDHRDVRAGDRDRDRVAEKLRVAVGEGRISLEELNERIDRVYAARTLGDLDGIVADLPGDAVTAAPVRPVVRTPTQYPAEYSAELQLHTVSGRLAQVGRWVVPRTLSARAGRWGRVRIDFTQADCPHHEVVLDVGISSWFGDVIVVVPRGWRVRDDEVVRLRLGAVHNRPPVPLAPDGVTVRLTGYVRTGDVWVRYRRSAT
ncbi:DUF1707 and DUF2154 domain-containing protein [Microbispora sp. RL4-1S]|uniref:DUF1707 and DUF2154 domain-containing protein n=1 Tax=Microbispora oryzae TaxID=2806554 RepID=A0A941AL87_9ACTN|nr:DUF1707 domain-containing protein [Microbispora oryzae]MBP2707906.1 DUF1707 and DUF2154 domain-containing protein [Microbispora oryzae]